MRKYFPPLIFLINNLISTLVFSQALSVNTNQLTFGNVFENSPDSLQLTISNVLPQPVTVTGIKFYNTYGSPAFSTQYRWFTVPGSDSVTIWIKFSPRHNIFHNTEMVIESDGHRGYTSVNLLGQGKYSDHYYDLSENISEENLKNVLKLVTGNGFVSLGYNVARDSMFMRIDNKKINGQGASQNTLECIYTGREAIGYINRTDCQTNFSFNTEHTYPQSFFSSMEPMRSDLHHLFPTDDAANNERDNNRFDTVVNPSWTSGGSLSNGTTFEPRDVQKGASARALFYFVIRYQNYNSFLDTQEAILRTWHYNFLPTAIEKKRNSDINNVQHNKNPFIDYPVFLERINSVSSNSVAPIISSIDLTQDTIIFGTVPSGIPVIYNYVIVNNGNTDIDFSNFNLTHPGELSFVTTGNDTTIQPGESLTVQIECQTSLSDSIRAFLTFNSDATDNLQVSIPIFVNDLVFTNVKEIFSDLVISPNPANDYLKIDARNSSEVFNCFMFDITGKKIYSLTIYGEGKISLEGFNRGIYFLHLNGKKNNLVRKIVIE